MSSPQSSEALHGLGLAFALATARGDLEAAQRIREEYERAEVELMRWRDCQSTYYDRDYDTRRFRC